MSNENQPNEQPENIGNLDSMIEATIEELDLPVPLTTDDRLALGEEICKAQEEAELLEDKLAGIKSEYKGSIEKATTKVSECSRKLRHGKKIVKVQCRTYRDYRLGYIKTIRLDNDTEVISRPMTADERQSGLFEE